LQPILKIIWKLFVLSAKQHSLVGKQNFARLPVRMLGRITNIRITFPSNNVGDKEDNFLSSKKGADANVAATQQIKPRSPSTTLTQGSNLFRLISEIAQTLLGKRSSANRRSVNFCA
jgi:hypothetical protein